MRRRTARVLKYVTITVGLLLFGNMLCLFCITTSFTGFGENESGTSQGRESLQPAAISKSTEVLHIGLVVQSYSDCRYASLQVKSLLMHRHNPLHLHLLTNPRSAMILSTLIDTWHIPYLSVNFYTTDETPDLTDLKLWLPALVPEAVHKLVIFDSNIIVGSDITALWQEFGTMRKEGKALGVLLDTYNGKLDTRLMLVNVTAVRGIKLFRGIAQIMEQRAVYRITSAWNLDSRCWIHTGPLNCAKVLSQHVSDTTFEEFMTYNSYRLQSIDQAAPVEIKDSSGLWDWLTSSCSDMRRRLTYRVHPYFIKYSYHPRDTADISLVTQLSFDRIHMLIRLLELWEGPVSATIYMDESQVLHLMVLIHNTPMFQRTNFALHVVYKKGDFLYPVNFLRNIAWNYSTTPYIFINDVDLMPSSDLYIRLKDALRPTLRVNSVYVIPAFETLIKDLQLPSSKQSLQHYVSDKQVSPFKWHSHKIGHEPTDYKKWFQATEPYEVRWKEWYEPYIVVHHNATRFDERFAGYGENKVSHILELHAQRYRFVVLPNVYVIHYPHKPSRDETKFHETVVQATGSITNSHYYSCMQQIQEEFCRDLTKKYGYCPCERVVPARIGTKVIIIITALLVVGIVYVCYRYCRLYHRCIYSMNRISNTV